MSLLDKLKKDVEKENDSSIQEIGDGMLERIGEQITGNSTWCKAAWGSGCAWVKPD